MTAGTTRRGGRVEAIMLGFDEIQPCASVVQEKRYRRPWPALARRLLRKN
jgi:hypothetical protein